MRAKPWVFWRCEGGVAEHARMLESLGAQAVLVKSAEQLANLDALVLPGGESSTIDRLTRIFGLRQPLIEAISGGSADPGNLCRADYALDCD